MLSILPHLLGLQTLQSCKTMELLNSPNYEMHKLNLLLKPYTVEAPVSGHPREAEEVSVIGAGRLRE